jgi:hypothetical protein
MAVELWVTHSLEKVFPDTLKPPRAGERVALKAARNETEDAQIMLRVPRGTEIARARYAFSDLAGPSGAKIAKKQLSAWWVWYTYVLHNPPQNHDPASYLRQAPAFFPDGFLEPPEIALREGWTHPLWVSVAVPKGTPAGEYSGTVTLELEVLRGETLRFEVPITVTVWPFTLPDEFHLHHTEWSFPELLARYYHLEPWSEGHWRWLEKVAADMARHKQDMILTSFPTLVKVTQSSGGKLGYDFSLLDRWVRMHRKAGITWIEGGHVAGRKGGWTSDIVWRRFPIQREDGSQVDTAALSEDEWEPYLEQFLKAVHAHLRRRGWADRYVQHVADEPIPQNEASWCHRAQKVKEWLPEVPRIDAVMSGGLEGYVDIRVPQIHETGPEVPRHAGEEMWSYVCLSPQGQYPNRFLDYPSIRNRIIFWLSWSLGLKGFLHWGYNYWGKWQQVWVDVPISPWMDATGASHYVADQNPLPAGDPFLVYPGRERICSSIRWEVIRKGFEDYEYLYMLEQAAAKSKSRAATAARKLLARVKADIAPDPLAHTRDDAALLGVREEAGALLAELVGEK